MSAISGSSLLLVQAYASRPAPVVRAPDNGIAARADRDSAFSVALSQNATAAMGQAAAVPGADTGFQAFLSAADMGAINRGAVNPTVTHPGVAGPEAADTGAQFAGAAPDFAREAPLRPGGAPVRHIRPGTHLDIKA